MSTMKRAPVAFSWKACASDGRLRGALSPPLTKATRVQHGGLADRGHHGGLVDHADLDRIRAQRIDLPGGRVHVDEGVGAGRSRRVELVHQERNGAVGP